MKTPSQLFIFFFPVLSSLRPPRLYAALLIDLVRLDILIRQLELLLNQDPTLVAGSAVAPRCMDCVATIGSPTAPSGGGSGKVTATVIGSAARS